MLLPSRWVFTVVAHLGYTLVFQKHKRTVYVEEDNYVKVPYYLMLSLNIRTNSSTIISFQLVIFENGELC